MLHVAKSLNREDAGVQIVFLCGKNEAVARELRSLPQRIPMRIEGFTPQIPYFMALADFFVGKPGPGSISEALAMHLPVIVQRNAWTLAHERYNADWIEERGVGIVVRNFSQVFDAVRRLLAPDHYPGFQQRAREIRNFAVYEVPELLERIMRASAHFPAEPGINPPASSNSASRFLPDNARWP
jgi:1,2-diacylglycerol 3-beta-galactosyltransferase